MQTTQIICDRGSDGDDEDLSKGIVQGILRGNGYEHNLYEGENIVGRSLKCDIIVDDSTVSETHGEINCSSGQFFVKDLRSTNGTFVEQPPRGSNIFSKVNKSKQLELHDGLSVKFGSITCILQVTNLFLMETQNISILDYPTVEDGKLPGTCVVPMNHVIMLILHPQVK